LRQPLDVAVPARPRTGRTEVTMASGAQRGGAADPVVTVVIATFDHARYIGAAIDGVLAQATDFPVEILISEDASTDGTREIVLAAAAAHPERIRTLLSPANLRSNAVIARGLRQARGRYVALLDGDDHWIHTDRLQRLADHLDANPGTAAVFDNALVAEGDVVGARLWTRPDHPARLDLDGIFEGNPFATCAGLMRTACLRDLPDWYDGLFPITDWLLYILCARHGTLDFTGVPSAVYRLHPGGLFSSLGGAGKLAAVDGFYRQVIGHAGPDLAARARIGGARYFIGWAEETAKAGDLSGAWACYRRALALGGPALTLPRREALRTGSRLLRRSMRRA
jgi:hypothetical protein